MMTVSTRWGVGIALCCLPFYLSATDCLGHLVYQQGNIPVLLTSPHGAPPIHQLPNVAKRRGLNIPSFVNRADAKVDDITQGIATQLEHWQLVPFVVIAGIHRSQKASIIRYVNKGMVFNQMWGLKKPNIMVGLP